MKPVPPAGVEAANWLAALADHLTARLVRARLRDRSAHLWSAEGDDRFVRSNPPVPPPVRPCGQQYGSASGRPRTGRSCIFGCLWRTPTSSNSSRRRSPCCQGRRARPRNPVVVDRRLPVAVGDPGTRARTLFQARTPLSRRCGRSAVARRPLVESPTAGTSADSCQIDFRRPGGAFVPLTAGKFGTGRVPGRCLTGRQEFHLLRSF
jgi:hypothetical protein